MDNRDFRPASTVDEALGRIFGLTGREPVRSRGEKRALVALRDALGLDVDIARTNAGLGAEMAEALGQEWDPGVHTDLTRVTLEGLNILLLGAAHAKQIGSLQAVEDSRPPNLEGPEWRNFQPARTKIEAVTRIAALTNAPPETLGPGSKERKSALQNLARNLPLDVDLSLTKTQLGAAIAAALNVPWTDLCASTGETISLMGLNTILAGVERRLSLLGTTAAGTFQTAALEAEALVAALRSGLDQHWDGKESVEWLAANELRGAHDNEWQGFYGEERSRIELSRAFTPPVEPRRVRYGNTVFDYSLGRVWDIKVHTEVKRLPDRTLRGRDGMQLNDERAVRQCVAEQGLGFLVLNGEATMDHDGSFVTWHREYKARRTGRTPARRNPSGRSRPRKSAFTLSTVEAFWVANSSALEAAIASGALCIGSSQLRQAPRGGAESGATRNPKFSMAVPRARQDLLTARQHWPTAG